MRYDRSRNNGLVVSRFLFVNVSYHTLPSLGSVTQLNPAVLDLDAMPNETQLTGKKKARKQGIKGLNEIRRQTCLIMKNDSFGARMNS